ncbi:MAG: metallophosphoesterase [Myxococcaceae bacterium]
MHGWLRAVFFVLFASVLFSAGVYLYRRLVRDVTETKVLRVLGAVSIIAVMGGFVLARILLRQQVGRGVATGVAVWAGLLLYTLLSLLVIEGIKLARRAKHPVDPDRRKFIARAAATGALVGGAGLSGLAVFRAYEPARETLVQVKLPGLPKSLEGFTICQLSDLHVGSILQERFVDELVERTNALKPDLIAVTGDLVDGKPHELGRFVARFGNLKASRGVFFVSGNHDYYSGWDEWSRVLPSSCGFQLLRNRWVTVGDDGGSFDLIGVEDYGSRHSDDGDGYDLEKALAGRDPSRPSILLSHQPGSFDDTIQKKLGLQLSGHTHGGQTFPITGAASLLWGPRAHGLSKEQDSQLFVSRGCGFVGPPMRLGSPPEIAKIVLLAG